ncbi:MAG: alpha-ketoacid dehydrogenase subunit beta, partial [Betaproteobacteria bacterium]|nr:alpha-ketoacid dehydrogenase subunit beta [Betaproteobacteria bacterium]
MSIKTEARKTGQPLVGPPAGDRALDYGSALNEAFLQLMERDPTMVLIGQGLYSPWYVGNSMVKLEERFGKERVIDCPVSESAMTGVAIGLALAGVRAVMVHPRMDFMVYATDPIFNQAAKAHYMFAGQVNVPVVIRGIINRGNEQAAQHAQALQSIYMHQPGLKVVMPATPYDAKGLLIASVRDDNPVIFIDDRWLYSQVAPVPEDFYVVPLGKGAVLRPGSDVTVVATSYMTVEALSAAEQLAGSGVSVEVIDPRTLKPLDEELIYSSVEKTGRLVVADAAFPTCGAASEIAALAAEHAFSSLKAPIQRVTLPDAPAPCSTSLEEVYFPKAENIVLA